MEHVQHPLYKVKETVKVKNGGQEKKSKTLIKKLSVAVVTVGYRTLQCFLSLFISLFISLSLPQKKVF